MPSARLPTESCSRTRASRLCWCHAQWKLSCKMFLRLRRRLSCTSIDYLRATRRRSTASLLDAGTCMGCCLCSVKRGPQTRSFTRQEAWHETPRSHRLDYREPTHIAKRFSQSKRCITTQQNCKCVSWVPPKTRVYSVKSLEESKAERPLSHPLIKTPALTHAR